MYFSFILEIINYTYYTQAQANKYCQFITKFILILLVSFLYNEIKNE